MSLHFFTVFSVFDTIIVWFFVCLFLKISMKIISCEYDRNAYPLVPLSGDIFHLKCFPLPLKKQFGISNISTVKEVRVRPFINYNKTWLIFGMIIFLSMSIISSKTTSMLLNIFNTWKNFMYTLKKLTLPTVCYTFYH